MPSVSWTIRTQSPFRARGIIVKYQAKPIYGSTPVYRSLISCSVSVTKLDKICNSKKESRLIDTHEYTSVSRKVVGKSSRDNPERYCGWFCLPCSPKKFERMAGEALDICSRVLMESNKSRFDSYSARNSVLIISHITFRDCRVHIFPTTFLEIAVYEKRKM